MDRALEGSKLFGSTKWRLDLSPDANCNLHRPKYLGETKLAQRESLNIAEHGVVHTTSVLETNYLAFKWHVARLLHKFAKRCRTMQVNTWTLCNAKFGIAKHGTLAPMNKGTKKEFRSTNNVEYELWFCSHNIKRCVNGNKD